ncbi:MAG: cytochrome c assembly protein, partial [Bacteroidetes bacterium]
MSFQLMTDQIQYVGEHLWPGRIGQPAVFLAFCSALLSALAFYFATQKRANEPLATSWRRLGRIAFGIHGAAVLTVIGCIFFVMINNYYEYQYVQAHVNDDLAFRYIFSAFWEGQEGSFLLWMFWHVVLGGLLILSARQWEAPVLSIVSSVQVIIGSMLLGVYLGFGEEAYRIGSNPMLLLRDTMNIPLFANAEYVSLLEGTGLNPLLQNWWMTVHPPTLFLGFASTVVPFSFAMAGLWVRDHRGWLKPVLPWALFSGAILGTGILMGGAWAYEALSFGGYWAWDPVENMSLVPWIALIAGIHTNLIARNTDHSIRASYIFYALSFLLIIYSTFLTRSGVLGETSVHAFTEMGLEWQLVSFIFIYLFLSTYLFFSRLKGIPVVAKEETTSSKEFWLFIGSLVLLFSAVLITVSTSLPVYNKIREFFDPGFVGHVITDPIPHFNKYQLWIGVFIGLLSGFSQFLRWRESNFPQYQKRFWLHLGVSVVLAAVFTYLTTRAIQLQAWQYQLLMFTGWFGVVTNLDHLIFFLRGNIKVGGSAISHIGFGLMIVGVLFSGLNQKVISRNPFLMEGLTANEEAKRNTVLLIQDSPMIMADYELTLRKDTMDYLTRTYFIDYKRLSPTGEVIEQFQLSPNILYDKTFTKVAASNPSTKQYWNRDIFTHIAALPPEEMDIDAKKAKEDSLNYLPFTLAVGEKVTLLDTVPIEDRDTFSVRTVDLELLSLSRNAAHPDYLPEEGDLAVGAEIRVHNSELDTSFIAHPVIVLRGQVLYSFPAQINPINTRVKLNEEIFDLVYTPEGKLGYQEYDLAAGDSVRVDDVTVTFTGFNRTPTHPNYTPATGDIAVGATLQVKAASGQKFT